VIVLVHHPVLARVGETLALGRVTEIAPHWPGHSCLAWFALVDTFVAPGVAGVTAGTGADRDRGLRVEDQVQVAGERGLTTACSAMLVGCSESAVQVTTDRVASPSRLARKMTDRIRALKDASVWSSGRSLGEQRSSRHPQAPTQ
jgi:hypothetical protein